ncbi:MAG: hypothetical protein KGZ58_03080 [Ignavibacteriales bacterium]|nr:hypothetical protein [Ignavibacteriales bacterium]
MSIQEIKTNVHSLVDQIESEKLLQQFYELLKTVPRKKEEFDFWDLFSEEQKHELELAWDESEHEENLVSNALVMEEAKQWRTK